MKKVFSILLLMVVMLSGCSLFEKKDDGIEGNEVVVNQPNVEVLAQKLQVPWSIDKVNQAFYISERTGSIVKIENSKTERQPVRLAHPLAKAAEAGLLGFVLDPQFQDN
ncbi:MAG: quinoprotein glucose dehydrogenase, partial [Bacillus sp. (in: firmicutes)]